MILPRFEDLQVKWARLEAKGAPDSIGSAFPSVGRLVTDGGPDGWGSTLWLPGGKETLRGAGKWKQADIVQVKPSSRPGATVGQ